MGLIRAIAGAAGGAMADQWKEFFYCETLAKEVLMVKGEKIIGRRSSNRKGSDNVISNGSGLVVADGQCMIIVEQGKIVDICAEPGEFTYDSTLEPSIFTGPLSESIKDTFKNIGKRFTYGGDPGKDQRVYYINTKELIDNKFGTANPIPFRVLDKNIGLDIDVAVRCSGVYSFKIADPVLFYTNIAGNVSAQYDREEIDGQLKTEFVSALQPAFAEISKQGVRPSELPGYAEELSNLMNDVLSKKWGEVRGLEIVSIGLNPITLPEADAELIKEAQRAAILRDPSMAAATLASAQAEAMKAAASNEGGALTGFMGLGMAQQAGGAKVENLFEMGKAAPEAGWTCSCGTKNSGKFCSNCGKPEPTTWVCECQTENTGKFCSNCGKPEPSALKCEKCGWEGKQTGKFCPECGTELK